MHREPPHYLQPLTTTTTPKRLLWLDCATTTTKEQGAYVKRFECAALGTTHWTSKKHVRKDDMIIHGRPVALWLAVDGFCTKGKRVVLFAHDLATQLRVSQGMVYLPMYGWTLEHIVLERTAAWALYRDGTRTLLMCDLKSWVPVELGKIASDLSYGKVTNFEVHAGPTYQAHLCMARAACVRDAMLQVFAWIEGENLGPFRPTGSGQSYSAFRRRFMTDRLLVHDDDVRLAAERAAMHTGRCEAWQHGDLKGGPFVEYDMHAAYCSIATECDVPTVAAGEIWKPNQSRVWRNMQAHAVLAHITVKTDIPVLPARLGGRTVWPVGEFDTWVWDPELRLAFGNCHDIKIHKAYRYHRQAALTMFGSWVLHGLEPQTQVYGLVTKRVLKHWSRCLVGRLGLRYRSWEKFAHDDESDLRLWTYVDDDEGTVTDMLNVGHDWLILTDMHEALESLPQIPSWVMSECRRRLWVVMSSAAHDLVYVDTDSVIMRDAGGIFESNLQAGHIGGAKWSRKGEYSRLLIHGPRNYSADNARHVSGVPLTARQVAPLEFEGKVMRSIKESMKAGELDCVTELPRTFTMNAPDLRRQHLPNHKTAPFRVRRPVQEDSV